MAKAAEAAATRPARDVRPPYVVGFYLVPEFPMMAFASAIEPLRSANRARSESLFDWRLYSRDGAPVRASNGGAVEHVLQFRAGASGARELSCHGIWLPVA